MTTKILIGASELAALLASHPDIELELTRQAASLVADQLLKKVDRNQMVNSIIVQINRDVSNRWSFPKEASEIIAMKAKERVDYELQSQIRAKVQKMIDKAFENATSRAITMLENKLNAKIDATVLDRVTATLKAAAKLGR